MNPSRSLRPALLAIACVGALTLSACGGESDPLSSSSSGEGGGSGGEVVVGSADFSESTLLAHIYAGALKADGVNATTKTGIGSREVYLKALEEGSVDVMPEYTGALALYYDKDFDEVDPDKTYAALEGVLPEGMAVLEKSAAEDKDSIVVTQETAESQDLSAIGDLEGVAGDMTLGAPAEFKERAQGIPGLEETYGVTFGDFRALKPGQSMSGALANGQIDAANIFSTDPAIVENDFVVLDDPKKLYGSQNVVPLVRADVQDKVDETLNEVSAKLTTEKLQEMLRQTDVQKKDPDQVAADFLESEGLD
ncbi:ABC transporter substrate-binding protein [Janibacter sp. DB-40]|uniref:ABC transporter substrate-binding protein n=1 Tax=Janibacter sp. DB-40 TaxID=3028808 RepID=UPI0024063556|nr:ABC transporter substrate-binding protein [Janibacter sp. DB-40]